jgi:hypothetical protein
MCRPLEHAAALSQREGHLKGGSWQPNYIIGPPFCSFVHFLLIKLSKVSGWVPSCSTPHVGVLELAASQGKRQLYLLIACRLERQATAVPPHCLWLVWKTQAQLFLLIACRLERQAWSRGLEGAMMRLMLSSLKTPDSYLICKHSFEQVPNRIEFRPILQVSPKTTTLLA